jgi:hypothetical protein
MRTQEEILERFNNADDLFGTQKQDLIEFMDFETAKPLLKEEYVSKVEMGEEKRPPAETDAKARILDYLPFAYDKAENQRGLSAARSLLHMKTWIWLDDPAFYGEIVDAIDNYYDYGIPVLNRISAHYGFVRETA